MSSKENRIQGALGLIEYEVTFYDEYGKFVYSAVVKASTKDEAEKKVRDDAQAVANKRALKFSTIIRKR